MDKKKEYEFCDEAGRKTGDHVIMSFDENDFLTLAQRYKELASSASDEPGGHEDMMYDLSGYLVEIDTGVIDADYMNSRFVKYLKDDPAAGDTRRTDRAGKGGAA